MKELDLAIPFEHGLLTRDEMQTDCGYATPDKNWVKDPAGNDWGHSWC